MNTRHRTYSLRNKIFWGFLIVSIVSIFASGIISYLIVRKNTIEQNRTQMQKKTDALMASLDYAVSHTEVETQDLKKVLEHKIFEIADINKQDIVLFDLHGKFLLSNKDYQLLPHKSLPADLTKEIIRTDKRVDEEVVDPQTKNVLTSSYMLLKNNMLEPIAIVYLPYYHNNSIYRDVFYSFVKYIVAVDILIILLSIYLSYLISKNLSRTLTQFSERINKLTLFDKDLQPVRYYHNDELGTLVKAYNKMLLQIQEQRERLTHIERENAWRGMAKQIAHEVKNPLTPMKLSIQLFERRFDPEDPHIREKVKELSKSMVQQIDLIAEVATAFSQFAQLPEKNNEEFEMVSEVKKIIQIFSGDQIFIHTNKNKIPVKMDRIYLNRIITNLVTNAKQAEVPERPLIVNIDIEQNNKRLTLTVTDNASGIPEEIIGRIFEPNFTSKNSGMGLGLAMVKKMVEDYNGEITVSSLVGRGTTFSIYLPTNL